MKALGTINADFNMIQYVSYL